MAFRAHVVRWLPLTRAELSDQLDRASLSSAFECLAVPDLLELEAAPPNARDARELLLRLMAILTALIRR